MPKRSRSQRFRVQIALMTLVLLHTLAPAHTLALTPEEVVVVVNARSSAGRDLADYYMARRGIPDRNRVLLSTPERETIDTPIYREHIEGPLRDWLNDPFRREAEFRCLLLFFGLPLRIAAVDRDLEVEIDTQKRLREQLRAEHSALSEKDPQRPAVTARLKTVQATLKTLAAKTPRASVDSELALIRVGDYERRGWLPNPYYVGYRGQPGDISKEQVLMVGRLDGPSPAVVHRMIDDSLAAEKSGLSGNACVDARWPAPDKLAGLRGYARYDAALHQWAAHLAENWPGKRYLDASDSLFGTGDCPDTALYCGWYSLGRYVDAFTWRPGAVAYHIASSECTTLKRPESQVWCKRLLEAGAAATLGPVYEPYVEAFPLPSLFFGLLTEGYLSLAECYQVSLPFISWQMVLIGDPLYRPFN